MYIYVCVCVLAIWKILSCAYTFLIVILQPACPSLSQAQNIALDAEIVHFEEQHGDLSLMLRGESRYATIYIYIYGHVYIYIYIHMYMHM